VKRDFPLKPFAIRHKLAGHLLLTLPRIAQLASELPRDLIEYNSGKVAISQDPDAIPSVDLDPVEVVKSIETAGAWMVLKRVENSPEYGRCWKTRCCRWRGRAASTACWTPASNRSRIFVRVVAEFDHAVPLGQPRTISSSTSTARILHDLDNNDRSIVGDDEIERSMTKHRNLKYDDSFAPRGSEFHLFAGDGCYVPYQWPHWVRTAIRIRSRWRSPGRPVDVRPPQRSAFLQFDAARHRPAANSRRAGSRSATR